MRNEVTSAQYQAGVALFLRKINNHQKNIIIMENNNKKSHGRNVPCRCGSGKKNKHCCKDYRTDKDIAEQKKRQQEREELEEQRFVEYLKSQDKNIDDYNNANHEDKAKMWDDFLAYKKQKLNASKAVGDYFTFNAACGWDLGAIRKYSTRKRNKI